MENLHQQRDGCDQRLRSSIQKIIAATQYSGKTLLPVSAALGLALASAHTHAARLTFEVTRDQAGTGGPFTTEIWEPGTASEGNAETVSVGPVLISDNENWPTACTVTGEIQVSGGSASREDDYILSTAAFSLTSSPIAESDPTRFNDVSQQIILSALEDFQVEEPETVQLDIINVTATCPGAEGGVVDVRGAVFVDADYGLEVTINDTFSEPDTEEPTEEPQTPTVDKQVPLSQKSLETQVNDIALLTLHSADARTRNISREIHRTRRGGRGLNTDNLSVNVNGVTVPAALWQSAIYGDQDTPRGAGAGDAFDDFGRWGVFVSGAIEMGERKNSPTANADFDSSMFIIGADYRLNSRVVLGGALSTTSLEANVSNGSSNTDFDRTSFSVFGSYYGDAYYIDLIVTLGSSDYELSRQIVNDTASADTDGDELSYALGAGYDIALSQGNLRLFTLLNYIESDLDGYQERATGTASAASVDSFTLKSLLTNAGVEYQHRCRRFLTTNVYRLGAPI